MAKKKVVTVKTAKSGAPSTNKTKVKPTTSKYKSGSKKSSKELTFTVENYKWIGIGFAGILLGLLLMIGGRTSPDTWDADAIYSFRRITLSPMIIVAGLSVIIYGIFKK